MQVVDRDGFLKVRLSGASDGLTVGTTPIASGTVGRVLFEGTGNVLQQSSSLFWDGTNNRLGIGTSSPTNILTLGAAVAASLQSSAASIFTSNENASNVFVQVAASNDPVQRPVFAGTKARGTLLSPIAVQSGDAITTFLSSAFDGTAVQASAALSFDAESNASSGNAPQLISFITGASGATRTTKMQVRSNGNVLIGTTTDAGFKLDVNGTARVSGALTTSAGIISNGTVRVTATTASPSGNGSFFVFDGAEGTNFAYDYGTSSFRALAYNGSLVRWLVSGTERGRFAATTGNLLINTTTDAGFRLDVNGTARVSGNATVSLNQNGATELNVSNTNNSAASQTLIRISSSSGSGLIGRYSASTTPYKTLLANDTFFYSAGTSDISFLNDFASGRIKFAAGGVSTPQMILKASGVLNLSSVPTSATGLSSGDIWNDGGILKIV